MDVFAAIADPVRRTILLEVARGPVRVVDLAARTHDQHAVSRPAISRHLRVLGEVGLVAAEDRGRERHYRLAPDGLAPVRALLERLVLAGTPVRSQSLDALATEVRRTSRDRRTSRAAFHQETA
ncbi:MAG: metalloregulator ArsR/SmtB family transcription factor [Nocardioides sp.]